MVRMHHLFYKQLGAIMDLTMEYFVEHRSRGAPLSIGLGSPLWEISAARFSNTFLVTSRYAAKRRRPIDLECSEGSQNMGLFSVGARGGGTLPSGGAGRSKNSDNVFKRLRGTQWLASKGFVIDEISWLRAVPCPLNHVDCPTALWPPGTIHSHKPFY